MKFINAVGLNNVYNFINIAKLHLKIFVLKFTKFELNFIVFQIDHIYCSGAGPVIY